MSKRGEWSAIVHGTVLLKGTLAPDAVVIVRDGRIVAAGPVNQTDIPQGSFVIDATDRLVVPGFIDIHIHGSGGCRAEDDAVGMARHVIRNGTTWFLPTLGSNALAEMLTAVDQVGVCVGPVENGATIGGIHTEGPFLNPKYGAQRPETCIEPDAQSVRQLLERCGNRLRLVTLAPERRGAIEAIECFRTAGAIVAIGHSDATEQEYLAGRAAGITHATHLFNTMATRPGPRSETSAGTKAVGIEELILGDPEMSADIVCDSNAAHVHPSLLKIAFQCKGEEGLSLITDAIPAAGLPCGEYRLVDGRSILTRRGEDVARLDDGRLCGSAMSMNGALRNFIKHTGVSLEAALATVSEAPARAIGWFDRKGSIAPGKDADMVLLDRDLNVCSVVVCGRIAWDLERSLS